MFRRRSLLTRLNFTQLESREVPAVNLLADLSAVLPNANQSSADFRPPTLNGSAYFVADQGASGTELTRSDGTLAGSTIVHDLSSGAASTNFGRIVIAGGKVVFAADPADGVLGPQLFVSDGTSAGTGRLVDGFAFPGPSNPDVTLSTVAGLAAAGDAVYWGGYAQNVDGSLRQTAYRTTVADKQTAVLDTVSNPLDEADNFVPVNNGVVFTAAGPSGRGLYTAGTTAGSAQFLVGTDLFRPFQNLVKVNDDFAAALRPRDTSFTDYELWVTDGRSVRRLSPPEGTTLLGGLVAAGGKAYYSARGADGTDQLWVTDGFVSNTVMLRGGLNPELNDAPLRLPRTDGAKLYFPASDGTNGIEMWVSDGTVDGTHMVANLASGLTSSVDLYNNTAAPIIAQPDGVAYFLANIGDTVHSNYLLHRTDGSTAGTFPVEVGPTVANLAVVSEFYVGTAGGNVLFRGGQDTSPDLWVADPASPRTAADTATTLTAEVLVRFDGTVQLGLSAVVSSPAGFPFGTVRFELGGGETRTASVVNGRAGPVAAPLTDTQLQALLNGTPPTLSATFVPDDPHAFHESSTSVVRLDLSNALVVTDPTFSANPVAIGANLLMESTISPLFALPPAMRDSLKVRFELSGPSYTGPLDTVAVTGGVAQYGGPVLFLDPGAYTVRAVALAADGRLVLRESQPVALTITSTTVAADTTTRLTAVASVNILTQTATIEITATVTSPGGQPEGEILFDLGNGTTDSRPVDRDTGKAGPVTISLTRSQVEELLAGTPPNLSARFVPSDPARFRDSSVTGGRVELPPGFITIDAPAVSASSVVENGATVLRTGVRTLLPVPTERLRVQFEAISPSGTVSPIGPRVELSSSGEASTEARIPLPPGEYTVRAVLMAGDTVSIGESPGSRLTVTAHAELTAPPVYQSRDGAGSFMSSIGSRVAELGRTFSGLSALLSQINAAMSEAYSRAYVAPMIGGDSVPDEVWTADIGNPGVAFIRDGATGQAMRAVLPFEMGFDKGLLVTGGDLNGDGQYELVFTPDNGGSGRTVVYDPTSDQRLADFFGIDDPDFRGGARAAVGLIDGVISILVAAGNGGGPRLATWDALSLLGGGDPRKLFGDFFVFEETLRNGAFITTGDVTGDGASDFIAGGGPGGGPRVFILDGAAVNRGELRPVASFFAGDENARNGVKLAAHKLDSDDLCDLVTADPVTGTLRAYLGKDIVLGGSPPEHDPNEFLGGVIVD